MDFLTRLELDSPWTQSEQVVVDHILANPESVLATTPKQLAQTCYVSTSSLYRLLSKLGLDGFSTLQAEISKSLLHREKEKADVDKNFPFSHMQTHYEIIEQLKADYDSTLASQKNLFDLYSLYEACKAMRNAKTIDLYTSAGNLGFFKNFQFQLREIGVNIHMAENDYEQTLMAASAGPDHLAIVLTMEGRSSTIPAIAYALEQSRTPVILLSAPGYESVFQNVKAHLWIDHNEHHYRKISSFATRMSLLYTLDVLYAIYFQTSYEENLDKKFLFYHRLNPTIDD
ncbi:MurR/RpiR family transcriptional regulator [uncultured Dubosiella sp.]|uniref:MurR/RpiR family transcriptional regulator n=1 Tax=uncultured Dubosiella sp. TaxID=1937011 RepID=UPI00272F4A6B|nr:MurR/RpiR family transcriptional regulator [uncultured Dubosiella sp.]